MYHYLFIYLDLTAVAAVDINDDDHNDGHLTSDISVS